MLIYRLENEAGEGCYGRGFGYKCSAEAISDDPTGLCLHPGPTEEPKLMGWWNGDKLPKSRRHAWQEGERRKWGCAFESLDQLTRWFPLEGLARMMFLANKAQDSMALVIYEVPHHKVKRGDAQCVYHKDHAVFQQRITLNDLCNQISG